MRYLKTYESLFSNWFKKDQVEEKPSPYGFTEEVTINGVSFKVGDHVKRKKDNKIGVIENIEKIIKNRKDRRVNLFTLSTGEPFDYVPRYTYKEIYKDEETEFMDDTSKYNV